jgi:hypothetical protein
MAVAAGATALATLIALAGWAGQRPDEPRSPGGSGRPSASRSPSSPSPSASATFQAPDGYKLVFAERPFTFAPSPTHEQWNIIDFDIPQATLFALDSLGRECRRRSAGDRPAARPGRGVPRLGRSQRWRRLFRCVA